MHLSMFSQWQPANWEKEVLVNLLILRDTCTSNRILFSALVKVLFLHGGGDGGGGGGGMGVCSQITSL